MEIPKHIKIGGGVLAGLISTLAAATQLFGDVGHLFHLSKTNDTAVQGDASPGGTKVAMIPTPPLPVVDHTGPIRLSVLPFKNLGKDKDLAAVSDGLEEAIVTDFGSNPDVKLIERSQIDVNMNEVDFGESKYVDKTTRAQLGKINGAEVVVIGGYQQAGKTIRATARFVNSETGEVIEAVKVEKPASQVFDLQDALAAQVKAAVPRVKSRLRPS